jgi:hypothetical protein
MSCRTFHQSALLPKALHTTSMRGFGVAHIDENPRHFDPIFNYRRNSSRTSEFEFFAITKIQISGGQNEKLS